MSTPIGKALASLEHDTSSLRLAPPAQIRARGEAWRRRRVAGGVGGVVTAVAGVAVTIFGIAAVGGGSATSPAPVNPTIDSSAAVDADCGSHVVQRPAGLPAAATACFLDAVAAQRSARLATTTFTVEGDPIHILYVAGTTGAVQVTTDTRQDQFGPRTVTRQTCTGPRADGALIWFAQCSSPVPA